MSCDPHGNNFRSHARSNFPTRPVSPYPSHHMPWSSHPTWHTPQPSCTPKPPSPKPRRCRNRLKKYPNGHIPTHEPPSIHTLTEVSIPVLGRDLSNDSPHGLGDPPETTSTNDSQLLSLTQLCTLKSPNNIPTTSNNLALNLDDDFLVVSPPPNLTKRKHGGGVGGGQRKEEPEK